MRARVAVAWPSFDPCDRVGKRNQRELKLWGLLPLHYCGRCLPNATPLLLYIKPIADRPTQPHEVRAGAGIARTEGGKPTNFAKPMAEWDIVKAAALKILGKDAEVPDMPDSIQKVADELGKSDGEFDKAREDCENKLLAVQNGNDAVRNNLKQFVGKIEKSDFKLNSKNPQDLKKILQARKLLTDRLNAAVKAYENDDKMLDEVDKHLIQLGKYKPKAGL